MLHEVERFALGNAFGDVEQHDVAELFEANKMGERAANLAGTDQCNLGTRHVRENLGWKAAESPAKRVIDRFRPVVQAARRLLLTSLPGPQSIPTRPPGRAATRYMLPSSFRSDSRPCALTLAPRILRWRHRARRAQPRRRRRA